MGIDLEDWPEFEYQEKKAETSKAYLLVIEGEDMWLPKSQCELQDDGTVKMSPWIAGEKGLG